MGTAPGIVLRQPGVQVVCDPCIDMLFCGEALKDVRRIFKILSASAKAPRDKPSHAHRQSSYAAIRVACRAVALSKRRRLVEAAGVEPASEIAVQPGEFMLCPIPFGFAPATQNGTRGCDGN